MESLIRLDIALLILNLAKKSMRNKLWFCEENVINVKIECYKGDNKKDVPKQVWGKYI